jgi:hypothetical protein
MAKKKPQAKRIRLDAPNEQAIKQKERIAKLEADVKEVSDDLRAVKAAR